MSAKLLVISGWSNSGKSTFTEWLASKHRFVRLDMEELILSQTPVPRVRKLGEMWATGNANDAVNKLQASGADTVVDWPYNPPPNFFQGMLTSGLPCWWFDADPAQARLSFVNRKRRQVEEFDAHARAIAAHQYQLPRVYGARFLRTLHLSGTRLHHPDVWDFIRFIEGW